MLHRGLLFVTVAIAAHAQSTAFQWIQQLGGSQGQTIAGVATDAQGNIYIAGNTISVDFPVKSAVQPRPGGSGLYRVDGPGPQWQNLADSGLTNVSSVSADPRNPNMLYATTGAALYRSANAGITWSLLHTFPVAANTLAVDPSNSNILYIGTAGAGAYKSTDGGATFAPVGEGIQPDLSGTRFVLHIWVDPSQASVVFAGTPAGLARSSDGGATWQMYPQVNQYVGNSNMAFDSRTPGLIYATSVRGTQKSTDDGLSWTLLPSPNNSAVFQANSIAIDPKQSSTIYTSSSSGGLYKSVDGGDTWTFKYLPGVAAVAADPATGALYLAANGTTYTSLDGFETFTAIGPLLSSVTALLVAGPHLFLAAPFSTDVFVTKLDPQGNVVYSTYFGGAANDTAASMAVDAAGNLYVTGTTTSNNFPISSGAYAKAGGSFLFKLTPAGSIAYSTYVAPAGTSPSAVALDAAGHAFVAGLSYGDLPTTPGAYETTFQGTYPPCCVFGPPLPRLTNAFLTEFDTTGGSLVFSTYIGSYYDFATALAVLPDGSAVLAGGGKLYHMQAGGAAMLQSITLPATLAALTTDREGAIYAGGVVNPNNAASYPVTPGAFQTAPLFVPTLPGSLGSAGGNSAFVTKFDSHLNVLASTLLGGESQDQTLALAIGVDGNIIAGGAAASKAFPSLGSSQGPFAASTGFVAELTPDLTRLVFSTYTGDTRQFNVRSVAPAADGGVLFAGATAPVPYFSTYGGITALTPLDATYQGYLVKVELHDVTPRIDSVVNAASHLQVPLSPGEVLLVNGASFGKSAILLVNGASVPLLSASDTTLTASLPLDFKSTGAATVTVQSDGRSSNSFLSPTLPAAPGAYSVDGSGVGQGYILNEDGTLNSPSNPAKEGAPITIFATGVGQMHFVGDYAVTASPVNVFIDGFYAYGIAATLGLRSGLPGSVYQISVYVPHPADYAAANPNLLGFVMPPQVAVTLEVNGVKSQAGLALSVGH